MARKRVRDEWQERIKAVEREYLAARKAVDDFIRALELGTGELPPNTQVRDAETMADNLEGTYLIRLFAAFESGLRSYWATIRSTKPPVKDLINSIAGHQEVPDEWKDEVHEVREYRNCLVHEREEDPIPVSFKDSRGRLCKFFAKLPENW